MPALPPGVHAQFPADAALTPLFRQYAQIKERLKGEHPGSLLLYRLGDFYELFGQDAVTASGILGLTLTSRACGKDYKLAMCGVPHHSSARYIKRLVAAGQSCAICEQLEDPALAKGLVERDVTRVVTAGTLVEEEYLDGEGGNFMAAAARRGDVYGVALLESSGGSVELFELDGRAGAPPVSRAGATPVGRAGATPVSTVQKQLPGGGAGPTDHLLDLLLRHKPAEVLLPAEIHGSSEVVQRLRLTGGPSWRRYENLPPARDVEQFLRGYFAQASPMASLGSFGLDGHPAAQAALFALVRYLRETFKVGQLRLYPKLVPLEGRLHLDSRAAESLELVSGETSLYALLSPFASTGAGRRLLRSRLLTPFADAAEISARHEAVAALHADREHAARLGELLDQLPDVERIAQRAALGKTHPKEVAALGRALVPLSQLRDALRAAADPLLAKLGSAVSDFGVLARQIEHTLADDPPLRVADGGVVRPGADSRVDELRDLASGNDSWFAQYEQQQRERTGIRALKVKHTDAFGWFIEVGRGSAANVPVDYQRRQTLVSAERYTTPELTQRDTDSRSAGTQLAARERELFEELVGAVAQQASALAAAAHAVAEADLLLAFALVAKEKGWVRPEIGNAAIELTAARHPLVEEAVGARYYTPNDCYLDAETQQVQVLTGPNMGGKSTFLRMVAICCVLNQAGSYVPAERAQLPLLRRIYTRVGAEDRLSRGQSTFMVEMVEAAEILNTCGPGSLVILDEVGRGTSTYDGISIAKAVLEHLHEHPARPLTLFATHFFELTDLEAVLPRVRNFHVEVASGRTDASSVNIEPEGPMRLGERADLTDEGVGPTRFLFLYKVAPGAASDSFGIEVAAQAGLPDSVVSRARRILAELEEAKELARERARQAVQLGLWAP